MNETKSRFIETIFAAFKSRGSERYGEEEVTQLQHALQSAQLAVRDGVKAPLVAAALLHDIGHILGTEELPESCGQDLDDGHESKGYEFLKYHFGDEVADPVRLHVKAKRYLCTTQPEYRDRLSPTSLKSFHDQGGEMSAEEQQQFEAEPHFQQAVQLRHWDDAAKDRSAQTSGLEDFADCLEASWLANHPKK